MIRPRFWKRLPYSGVAWCASVPNGTLLVRRNGYAAITLNSHGLNVLAFAADGGQDFDTVLSLSGPVREDMAWVRQRARAHIRRWVQVVDPSGHDTTIIEGETFDGEFGWHFDLPEADLNVHAQGVGHSGLVYDISRWDELGLWRHFDA